MKSYPNQNKVRIKKQINGGGSFMQLDIQDFYDAAKVLNYAALRLYVYLAKNKDGYETYLSGADFTKSFDVSDSTYRRALDELKEKGYIKEIGDHYWCFSTKADFTQSWQDLKAEVQEIICNIDDDEIDTEWHRELNKINAEMNIENVAETSDAIKVLYFKKLLEVAKKYKGMAKKKEIGNFLF